MMRELTSEQQANELIDSERPAWLLKHSATCPISAGAIRQFRQYVEDHSGEAAGVVTVQDHKPVSEHITDRLGVRHETPQLFLVRGGEPLWHTSHSAVTAKAMEEALRQHA